jgi:hypothetical protein
MKKLQTILISALLLTLGSAFGQSIPGVKGGINFSTLNGNQNFKTGFHAGLLWHTHLGPSFALQPEVVYSLQGVKLSGESRLNLGYINTPFLVQLQFGDGLRLEAGPQLGFLATAKTQTGNSLENVRRYYKTLEAGLAIGFGFLGNAGFGFDARYNYGLSDISKSSGDVYNRVFQVGLFYQFRQ